MGAADDLTARKRDPRLLIIVGASVALVIAVAMVALLGGGDADEAAATAPERCVKNWNSDPDAIAFGVHNYGSHGYDRVEVTLLTEGAETPAQGEKGVCAVIFGAIELDSEPVAAGQLLIDGTWSPISLQPGVELTRVAELQAIAAGAPNSSLSDAGLLAPS